MLKKLGENAKKSSYNLAKMTTGDKNMALNCVAEALINNADYIIANNRIDVDNARENGMKESLIDRLYLDLKRIEAMADGLRQIAILSDPIGEVLSESIRPNGLKILKKRVPIGVIGIIYEARPNVTADAFGLCFKTGNAVILKGGSDAINSNKAIVSVIREALASVSCDPDVVSIVESTDREVTKQFMRLNEYIDLLIPRGGANLIKATIENSTIPVIETGTGNCHIFIDKTADMNMARDIIINAKTQRTGVCNACESIVLHKEIVDDFANIVAKELINKGVEIRADLASINQLHKALVEAKLATEEDFYTEYLDYIVSVKTVNDIDEAISHINEHNTKHSEAIITNDDNNAKRFLDEIDAACVYVNASTRFTDGFEFGFGAEIGISTQKIHARGPMGLSELTSSKYVIYGNGQIR